MLSVLVFFIWEGLLNMHLVWGQLSDYWETAEMVNLDAVESLELYWFDDVSVALRGPGEHRLLEINW